MSTTLRLLGVVVFLNLWILSPSVRLAHATSTGKSDCTTYAPECITQGARYRNLGGSDNGVHAYLAGSGHINNTGTVLASVAIQTDFSGTGGFIQTGELQVSPDWADNCGSGATFAFVEYVEPNSNSYHCVVHTGITPFGDGGLFALRYRDGAWEARRDSSTVWTATSSLGFTSGYSCAFVESAVNPSNGGQAQAMTFGLSGHNPWAFSTDGGVTWSTIYMSLVALNNDSDGDSDGDWSLGGSPSPFNLNWGGF